MVGPVANRQNAGFQWIKWSEIGWPRLVDIPPERQTTWFARITPVAPPVVVAKTTVDSPCQGDGAADSPEKQEETVPIAALPEEGSAPASPAGVEVAPLAAEPDSAVEAAPEAPVAEVSAPLEEPATSQDDAELPVEVQENPGLAEEGERTPERAPSLQEDNPPIQMEDQTPSPAKPDNPKEDVAKSVSSASSEHAVQPPSDVAKGKRKCINLASSEESVPFYSAHQRSFPLVRNKSLSSLRPQPPVRTKTLHLGPMGHEDGELSRPTRSVLEAFGLRDSEWDDAVLASNMQFALPTEPIGVVPEPVADKSGPVADKPEPVADRPNPVIVLPEPLDDVADHVHELPTSVGALPDPFGDVTDHVYDLPKPRGTLPERVRTPPMMSGALPVPAGWQPEPIVTPTPAEVPKVRWMSRLLRKLRNAALPKPILQLLLGREIADQAKAALELYASGAA